MVLISRFLNVVLSLFGNLGLIQVKREKENEMKEREKENERKIESERERK